MYGVSIVSILDKIDCIIMAPPYILLCVMFFGLYHHFLANSGDKFTNFS